jgi:hypothetical protein
VEKKYLFETYLCNFVSLCTNQTIRCPLYHSSNPYLLVYASKSALNQNPPACLATSRWINLLCLMMLVDVPTPQL